MRVCIIAEGSYPYVTGGVSSWIHNLVTELKEIEFVIYTIAAYTHQKGKFKYTLPTNVVEVKETFLDSYLNLSGIPNKRYKLSDIDKQNLYSLLGDDGDLDWFRLFNLLRNDKIKNVADFLQSKDFYDVLQEICIRKYPLVPFTEMFWMVRSMLLPLFLAIREEIPKADLYHSVSTGYAGIVGTLASTVTGAPFLLTEHGIYSREREEEIIKADWVQGYFKDMWIKYFYRLSLGTYEHADKVITLFNRNREIEIELGCDPEKITIIPNGINIERYKEINRVKDEPDIIYVGAVIRVVPIKDIKTMIQSFALVKQEMSKIKFFIMGSYEEDEEYYDECLKLMASLEVEDVIFTGTVNVMDYIGKMDILVLTSISEGQPLAILEGMAACKPFVATNVGSCSELLEGLNDGIGRAGLIVPVMYAERIAQHILYLARQDDVRKQYGINAERRVTQHYKQEDVVIKYRALYTEMGG